MKQCTIKIDGKKAIKFIAEKQSSNGNIVQIRIKCEYFDKLGVKTIEDVYFFNPSVGFNRSLQKAFRNFSVKIPIDDMKKIAEKREQEYGK